MCKKILRWWNNLSFCKKKKEQWLKSRQQNSEGLLTDLKWPKTIFHTSLKDFEESDWVYSEGDRCERFICWFFKYITKRCTVLERTPEWIPMDCPTGVGCGHPEGYITSYKVRDDDGNKIQEDIDQNDLSY